MDTLVARLAPEQVEFLTGIAMLEMVEPELGTSQPSSNFPFVWIARQLTTPDLSSGLDMHLA